MGLGADDGCTHALIYPLQAFAPSGQSSGPQCCGRCFARFH